MKQPAFEIDWRFIAFDALTTSDLYAVLQLRSEVFVVEQACVFQDLDGADAQAMHLLGRVAAAGASNQLVAYARCLPAGVKYAEASIGRVVTHASVRDTGTGHQLLHQAIAFSQQQWGGQAIRIGAQAHLAPFYQQHAFTDAGRPYVEDGIDHLEMLRAA